MDNSDEDYIDMIPFNPDILVNRFTLLIQLVKAMDNCSEVQFEHLDKACELTIESIEEGMKPSRGVMH
jgi:hypothetical protein